MSNAQAQTNTINLEVHLDTIAHTLGIQQKIVYYNTSSKDLSEIYLHNWPNSFKSNKSALDRRLLDDFKKDFHFAKAKDRGYTDLKEVVVNDHPAPFEELENQIDVLKIKLKKPLAPNDSVSIAAKYNVKIPNGKYTKYGITRLGYHLRYWYLVPAIFKENEWQLLSNMNLDDLFQDVAHYNIKFNLPKSYSLESNLAHTTISADERNTYVLSDKSQKDVIINIEQENRFKSFKTTTTEVVTDISRSRLGKKITNDFFDKQMAFIEDILGEYPHEKLLIDANSVNKNSLNELFGLPSFIKAYPKHFRYEIRLFQALSIKYIDDVFLINKRKDLWLSDGLQTFLMIEYLKKFYPDLSVFGRFANIWGIRSYNLAKIKHKEKFAILYQLQSRKLLNQPLALSADSLSNSNKKITNKFKAGLAFGYLQDYLGDSITHKTLKNLHHNFNAEVVTTKTLQTLLAEATEKELNWFFDDFLELEESIDYKLKNVKKTANGDSLKITIKNLNDIAVPISLYGIKDKEIVSKKWLPKLDSTTTITINNDKDLDIVALNHERVYPEFNSLDNYKKTSASLIKKPLQFRFQNDFEDPLYTQIFYKPTIRFDNVYNGVTLGLSVNNDHFIDHNFQFGLSPSYALRSKNLSGKGSMVYRQYFRKSEDIYNVVFGLNASTFNYQEDLRYVSFTPNITLNFRRKNLRIPYGKSLNFKLVNINREIPAGEVVNQNDQYSVASLSYVYAKAGIEKNTYFIGRTEFAENFSKAYATFRHVEFFDRRRSFDVRLYAGTFLSNSTNGDFFDFNLNRGSDYLFEQRLIARSEDAGFLSQQFILADGSFKSFFKEASNSNGQIFTANTSVSLWHWMHVYNNFGVLRNRNQGPRYFYENGIRLNFVQDFFELYFPIYTNEGWEVSPTSNYSTKIRFTITTKLNKLYNFFRRDFL